MNTLFLILLWAGAVLILLEALRVPARVSLGWLGLFCWILVSAITLTDKLI
jgi:hypothetical protein